MSRHPGPIDRTLTVRTLQFHVENDEFLAAEDRKLQLIREQLERSQTVTDDVLGVIRSFETRLEDLEDSVLGYIHDSTRQLTTAQANVRSTVGALDGLIRYQELAEDTEPAQVVRLQSDYTAFLSWLAEVLEATLFFQQNDTMKKSAEMRKALKDVTKLGIGNMEDSFRNHVNDASKSVSRDRLGWPAPAKFELLPGLLVSRLSRELGSIERVSAVYSYKPEGSLAQAFFRFLGSVRTARSQCLRDSLFQCVQDAQTALSGGVAVGVGGVHASATGIKPKRATSYERGSHPLVFYMQFCFELVRLEQQLVASLLARTTMSSRQFSDFFSALIADPLDFFLMRADGLTHKKHKHRVLVLLDLLEVWHGIVPQFGALLAFDEVHGDFRALRAVSTILPEDARHSVAAARRKDRSGGGGGGGSARSSRGLADAPPSSTASGSSGQPDVEELPAGASALTRARQATLASAGPHAPQPQSDLLQAKMAKARVKLPAGLSKPTREIFERLRSFETALTASVRAAITTWVEQGIRMHSPRDTRPDGGYHTLTVETIKSLRRLYSYRDTLQRAIEVPADFATRYGTDAPPDSLAYVTSQVLSALDDNLSRKAKQYKTSALQSVFLLNNLHYICKNIESSELASVAARGFFASYQRRIIKARHDYSSATWKKVLHLLDVTESSELVKLRDGAAQHGAAAAGGPVTGPARKAIKSKFAGFNDEFDAIFEAQKHFSVPDADLRSQMRSENVELILQAYAPFLGAFRDKDFSSTPAKYIRYEPAEVEQKLNKFFDEEA